METATKKQIADQIIANCKTNFGKTFAQVVKYLKNTEDFKTSGASYIIPITKCGHKIVITSNKNYCQGAKNGYGAGVYAVLQYTGVTKEVKISDL